ncbi:hypothetical protein V6U78_07570 [Marinospirillum sp. MEB164]|uniref:CAF17 C-terminal domain-containing protein n=1 Tax=Marinospirillum alkalitolerans TaxID=3123374 RepID=A0ABW8PX63_9GAMM
MSTPDLFPLPHWAVLALTGGQPKKLLQGQTTCDLRLLSPAQALPGLLCDLKGRVMASFIVIERAEDDVLLALPRSTLESLTQQLQPYLPFFRTQLQVLNDWTVMGSLTPTPAPSAGFTTEQETNSIALHLPYQSPAQLHLHAQTTTTPATPEQQAAWQQAEIESGWLWIEAQHQAQFLPQMLNFQALGAVSFKKGCYTGQEIVARAQFRGQVKKRLYRLQLADTTPLSELGIFNAQGQEVGQLVSQVKDQALAVIKTQATEEALFSQGSAPVSLLELPYDPHARHAWHGGEA